MHSILIGFIDLVHNLTPEIIIVLLILLYNKISKQLNDVEHVTLENKGTQKSVTFSNQNQLFELHIKGSEELAMKILKVFKESEPQTNNDTHSIVNSEPFEFIPGVVKKEPLTQEQITTILDYESVEGASLDRDELLGIGRGVQEEKPYFPTATGGGYVKQEEFQKVLDSGKKIRNSIPRPAELRIIHQFNGILQKPLSKAKEIVAEDQYTLRVLYVGSKAVPNMATFLFSGTVLGIRIKDPEYNFGTSMASNEAIVTEIIDVGGIDSESRGRVHL